MVERPARVKSAALRGPTPFRNCSGVCRYSPAVIGGRLLHDRGPTHRRVNLPDVRGQAEGRLEVHAVFRVGALCE